MDKAPARVLLPSDDVVVLGVDPGLADLGWGVLRFHRGQPAYVAHAAFHTPPGGDDWLRVQVQAANLREVVARYNVRVVGVEGWGFYKDCVPVEAHRIGLVIGAILGIPGVAVVKGGLAPEWRKSLGLPHQCTKAVVQNHVQSILRLPKKPTPQHASDALAVALATFPRAVGCSIPVP